MNTQPLSACCNARIKLETNTNPVRMTSRVVTTCSKCHYPCFTITPENDSDIATPEQPKQQSSNPLQLDTPPTSGDELEVIVDKYVIGSKDGLRAYLIADLRNLIRAESEKDILNSIVAVSEFNKKPLRSIDWSIYFENMTQKCLDDWSLVGLSNEFLLTSNHTNKYGVKRKYDLNAIRALFAKVNEIISYLEKEEI